MVRVENGCKICSIAYTIPLFMNIKNRFLFLLPGMAALAIGIYLILTTYLITKDGPLYIQQAQKLATSPLEVIKSRYSSYFGYPFLIFAAQKTASVFGATESVHSWIISAQAVTLLSMLAAFIPLYFIGKSFVGSQNSFYALLILAFLPYPVKFAAEVLRDWPYILFLSLGLAALIVAAKGKKWQLYGVAGFLGGLGYFIKVECAQVVIYGLLWLAFCAIWPRYEMTRKKALLSILLLLVCFAVIVLPYMHIRQQFIPEKIEQLKDESSSKVTPVIFTPLEKTAKLDRQSLSLKAAANNISNGAKEQNSLTGFTAGLLAGPAKAIIKVFERTGENLFYYFFVFSLIGFYTRFIKGFKKINDVEKIFTISFILLNVIMLSWLFYNFNYLSRRHCLPLSLLFVFYCPVGLKVIGEKIIFKFKPAFWFYILLAIGILICLPKLLESKRKDQAGFLDAAGWLAGNTKPSDLIAVPDERITFYAQRKGFLAWEQKDLNGADFAVAEVGAKDTAPDWGNEMARFRVDPAKKGSELIIYRLP
jgi:4-amino-4-deoxy-L-arabinose transferase-like glycosyltransferase